MPEEPTERTEKEARGGSAEWGRGEAKRQRRQHAKEAAGDAALQHVIDAAINTALRQAGWPGDRGPLDEGNGGSDDDEAAIGEAHAETAAQQSAAEAEKAQAG